MASPSFPPRVPERMRVRVLMLLLLLFDWVLQGFAMAGWDSITLRLQQLTVTAPLVLPENGSMFHPEIRPYIMWVQQHAASSIIERFCGSDCDNVFTDSTNSGNITPAAEVLQDHCLDCVLTLLDMVEVFQASTNCSTANEIFRTCKDVPQGRFCLMWPMKDAQPDPNGSNDDMRCIYDAGGFPATLKCPAGFSCAGGAAQPTACPKGFHCPSGSVTPQNCSDGNFCLVPTQQMACDSGMQNDFIDSSQLEGVSCMKDESGRIIVPQPCPAGRFCVKGIEHMCPEGYWCPLGSSEPFSCNLLGPLTVCNGEGLGAADVFMTASCEFLFGCATTYFFMRATLPYAFASTKPMWFQYLCWALPVVYLPLSTLLRQRQDRQWVTEWFHVLFVDGVMVLLVYGARLSPHVRIPIRQVTRHWGRCEYVLLLLIASAVNAAGNSIQFWMILNWYFAYVLSVVFLPGHTEGTKSVRVDAMAGAILIMAAVGYTWPGMHIGMASCAFLGLVAVVPVLRPVFARTPVADPRALTGDRSERVSRAAQADLDAEGSQADSPLHRMFHVLSADADFDAHETPISGGIGFILRSVSLTLATGQTILDRVSMAIPAGATVAVMGPSGSGKSTITNVLSGRAQYGNVSGDVLINGLDSVSIEDLRNVTSFVPQDDVMNRELTCLENVAFQVELRKQSTAGPHASVQRHAEVRAMEVLQKLGLEHVADTVIGDDNVRGISGGQRKRVSIALELVSAPHLLFLDEPTTGLDSTTSHSVIHHTKKISRDFACTAIAVIHQPRYETLMLFDELVLLAAGGHLVYAGRTDGMEKFFSGRLGVAFPEMANPADVMMDTITIDCARAAATNGESQVPETVLQDSDTFGTFLSDLWHESAHLFASPERSAMCHLPEINVATPCWGELMLVQMRRASLQFKRDGARLTLSTIVLFCGLVAICVSLNPRAALNNFFAQPSTLLFFLMLFQGVEAQQVFGGDQRFVAWRETGVGVNSIFSFLGRDVATMATLILPAAVFTLVYWPLMPVHLGSHNLFWSVYAFLYATWGLNFIFSIALDLAQAQLASVVATFICFLFAGVSPPFQSLVEMGQVGLLLMGCSPIRWVIGYWFYKSLQKPYSEFANPLLREAVYAEFAILGMPIGPQLWTPEVAALTVGDRWRGDPHSHRPPNCLVQSLFPLFAIGIMFRLVALSLYVKTAASKVSGGGSIATLLYPQRTWGSVGTQMVSIGCLALLLLAFRLDVLLLLNTT